MDLRKAYAIGVITVVLGLQIAALTPIGGGWYWPFMDYPMYSGAHYPGERITRYRLRLRDCDPRAAASPATDVRAAELHVPPFRYRATLATAVGEHPHGRVDAADRAGARRLLGRLIRSRLSGRYCRAEVWTQEFRNGQSAAEVGAVPWRLRDGWTLPRGERPSASGGAAP